MVLQTRMIITVLFVGLLVSLFGIYLYKQSYNLVQGPVLIIESPQNGATINDPFIILSGYAKHISYLSLNGNQLFTDSSGRFSAQLLLSEGYNTITLEAKDRFGRVEEKVIELVNQ